MRIGIDVRLKNETGVGRYIRSLVKWLPKVDEKNEYVFIDPPVRWHTASEQLFLIRHISKANIDLMHFPYFSVPVLYRKPYVVTIHDLIIDEFDTGRASMLPNALHKVKRAGYKYVTRNAVHAAKAIITPSSATKQELVERYRVSKDKVHVIYEGVSLVNDTKSKTVKKLADKSYFLYVGNAYPHKNLETLITAFNNLSPKTQNLQPHLVLVGKEDYFYKRLKEKITLTHRKKNIVFTGFVSDSELLWLYQHAKALILPSYKEGFGLPLVEAMDTGCPVAVSNIDVFHEIAGDAASYFNPYDLNELTNLLNKFLSNPELFKLNTEKGKTRAKTFSWKKSAKETVRIYEDCACL